MTDTLRGRIRDAAEQPAPAPDLRSVMRRARLIRAYRVASGAVVLLMIGAALAVPLYSLRHLGEGNVRHPMPAGPTFGDGSVSFADLDGWTRLQGGTIAACETTESFASEDLKQAQDLGPNEILGCRATAAALLPDGVLITASASDPYSWVQPNVNFPASSLPPTLDPNDPCGGYEGQPPGTAECHVFITANDRWLEIRVWFGTETPGSELMATAQRGLDALQVSEPASLGNDIGFEPTAGWYDQAVTPTTGGPASAFPAAWTSNVELQTYSGGYLPAGPSNKDIEDLSASGVIVSAEQWMSTRNPLPDAGEFQELTLPLDLSDARLIRGGWEGLAISDVSQLYLRGVVNGRPIVVQAFFRTSDPSPELIDQAQIGLNRLVVVPTLPPTTALDDFGISMQLPQGWHGWLYAGDPTLVATTSSATTPFTNDFGAPGVGQEMGPSDTTIVLDESDALQDLRWPQISGPPRIGSQNLCDGCEVMDDGRPPTAGHVLYRNTFTSGGRAFDLYVEFGSAPNAQQLEDANAILGTLQLTPDPSPEPPPPGATAVGSLPDGQRPVVGPTDTDRTLAWSYEHASMSVPDGWTGWFNLVVDSAEPLNIFALGSWDVPQGAYCAPITALRELPSDGMLIWIDRYGPNPPSGLAATPWPASPEVGPGTDPAPAPTDCTGGIPVQSFTWTMGGRIFAVHVAVGPEVSDATVRNAEEALGSFAAS